MLAATPDESSTDEALIARINRGDDRAFEVLYHRHRKWVTGLALRLVGCAKTLDKATQVPGRAPGTIADGAVAAVPGSRPSPHEELWIIASSHSSSPSEARPPHEPTSGALCARIDDQLVPMPLKHTDVKAAPAGYIASVKLRQQFHNPHPNKIEVIYVFPLPENAAINEFVMTIGDRYIRGIIRERNEAEAIYREARRQGYVTSLLTQERPNIFTQSVAKIEPGHSIDVTFQYFHTLESARRQMETKAVSWLPLAGWMVPDEAQHMRIRLKLALIDVRTGCWRVVSPEPFTDKTWSTAFTRGSSDRKQVESLKEMAYAAGVKLIHPKP